MQYDFMERYEFSKIRAKVKGFQAEGLTLSKLAQKFTGSKRNDINQLKKSIGYTTRNYLIAYAFIRKIPYSTIEPKCGKLNKPESKRIFDIIKENCQYSYGYGLKIENIEEYLADNNCVQTKVAVGV